MSRRSARIGLLVAGLLLGLLAAEGAARLASASAAEELLFRAPDGALRGLYQADADLLTVPVPGFSGTVSTPGYGADVRIDADGLRAGPPRSGPRWLAVGDSFTLSVQVPAEDTFEARLGAALGVDVRNAGVDGYSTWQALGRYRRLDPIVGSTTVLLVYFLGNDLTDNEVFPTLVQRDRRQGGALPPPPEPPSQGFVEGLLFRHSRLYAYLRVANARRALTDPKNMEAQKFKGELVPFTKGGAARLEQLVRVSERPLMELRDAARGAGDRLLVAVAPPAFAVDADRAVGTLSAFGLSDPDLDAPRNAIVGLLQRLDIPACDLTPALVASEERGEAPYLRFDGHWSVAGHAAVADALATCARGTHFGP